MKHFVDQNGNIVQFGNIVHYSENVSKKDFKSFFDIHVTLTKENVDKLKAIGAIHEKEISDITIDDYDNKLAEILYVDKKCIERLKSCFPAQYVSSIITLIHDDIDDEKNIKDVGYIFNISKGKMELTRVDSSNLPSYINIFSNPVTANACLNIIKPFIVKMYD